MADTQSGRYAVDSLRRREDRIFGWGWFVHPDAAVESIELFAEGGGRRRTLACQCHVVREDIAAAFPDWKHARTAGFRIAGFIDLSEDARWGLAIALANGQRLELEVPAPAPSAGGALPAQWRWVGWLEQALAWFGQGHRSQSVLRLVMGKSTASVRRVDAASFRRLAAGKQPPILILDHGLGGGTTRFAEQVKEARLTAGGAVVVATYDLTSLAPKMVLHRGGERFYTLLSDTQDIFAWAEEAGIEEILVNHLLGFPDPFAMLGCLRDWRRNRGLRLTYPLHDYMPACPSWALVNWQGVYCGVPDMAACRTCLPRNGAEFRVHFAPRHLDPERWRQAWGEFLSEVDEIRAFSKASVDILRRAYPALPSERIAVIPHTVEPLLPDGKPAWDVSQPLRLGIVGTISAIKGAEIVHAICARIVAGKLPIHVVVVGVLEGDPAPWIEAGCLTVTGEYTPVELPKLLAENAVNYCFFPSVWPETFSFLTSELIELGVPLAAFDLGAPAERLAGYEKGLLIQGFDADVALRAIGDHFERLRADAGMAVS